MAYTSVIPVFRLDNSIDYVRDKEKTAHPVPEHSRKGASAGSLREAINYALNREKTENTFFEDAIGCTLENAYEDMVATKKQFHKTDKVQGFHLVQSFAGGEVSPELAHLIGVELAEQLLKGEFEVVITTHLNTGHYHNHLVWNSVSMTDGHKYHSNSRSYYTEVRKISDDLCRKYGLSIIQPGKGKGKSYAEWMAEKNGKPIWRTAIRSDIREAVNQCFTWNQFLKEMEKRGYQWKLNQKYIALKAPGMERYIRLRSLGEGYSETAIRQRILQPKKIYPSSLSQKNGKRRRKLKGLQALYYSYLYQMGVFPEKPKRIPYEVREDIRRLDQRLAQADFLQKHGIITVGELQHFQNQLGKDMTDLITERRRLYRSSPGSERIREITEQLKPMRKEMRMAVKIAEVSKEMAERMKRAEEREQKQQFSREKDSREERDQKER